MRAPSWPQTLCCGTCCCTQMHLAAVTAWDGHLSSVPLCGTLLVLLCDTLLVLLCGAPSLLVLLCGAPSLLLCGMLLPLCAPLLLLCV